MPCMITAAIVPGFSGKTGDLQAPFPAFPQPQTAIPPLNNHSSSIAITSNLTSNIISTITAFPSLGIVTATVAAALLPPSPGGPSSHHHKHGTQHATPLEGPTPPDLHASSARHGLPHVSLPSFGRSRARPVLLSCSVAMADPLGAGSPAGHNHYNHNHDTSIDSVLSDGSSKSGTPRRAVHPALFPKATPTSETHGTIKASRYASPPARPNPASISAAFAAVDDDDDDEPDPASPTAAARARKNSTRSHGSGDRERGSPPPLTPANAGKGSKGRSSTARRSKMKSRKSISIAGAGASEDESSASENEHTSEKIFEQAFKKYDKNGDNHIPMADFLHFFDALQDQLPPLSEHLLQPGVREQMAAMMQQVMSQSDTSIYISKDETKTFYKAIAGKDITQELNERRQGTFPQNGEVSSFRGRLVAAQVPEGTPHRPLAISPERRTPFAGAFARPVGPRRQQSVNSNPMGDDDEDEDVMSDLQSREPTVELTGNFLASSTPAGHSKKPGHGYFSPPVTSPAQSSLSFGEFPGGRSAVGSPGFNTSAHLEADLAAVHRELRQKQLDFIEKEQELSDLRHRAERNREEFEDEITNLNDELGRMRGELEGRRRETVELNKEKDELRAEAAVYLDQISDAKRDLERFHHQHNLDRENILSLSQENQRYAQQAADALRRVEALTADLQTVMAQKEEVEIQRASLQRKADLITGLHKQIKDLREEQKDREYEIERLKSELNSRQLDIEMLMSGINPARVAGAKGGNRDSMGPGALGVLSDELEGAGVDDEEEEDGEDDGEEEEVVTTTKTIKRRKKAAAQKKPVIDASGIPDTADEPFQLVERIVDTTDRGTQANPPVTATTSCGTDMQSDEPPVPMFTAVAQTDVTLPPHAALQDALEAPLPPIPPLEFSMDEDGLRKIAEYEELARGAELTRQQLEELSKLIGVQSAVIERFKALGEANSTHRRRTVVKEKFIPGDDPVAYINYTTCWLQTWLRITVSRKLRMRKTVAEKGEKDEMAEFVEYNPQPNMAAVGLLLLLFTALFAMTVVIAVYTYQWQSHEAMWRRLNSLQGYPKAPGGSGVVFGSRAWRVFKYDLQRLVYGQVRFPV
ncbi:hypothetical protein Dda_4911 [Drechslerella dactyloides]|uniref:EF-hand domain-containing protein n=1 Tax=Drechslerella dactyloides TaxID=74499 RepID=A0AAD6IXT0_DREDA|nr:hypothetical protein Dda_4911 [Drechslerella dactyloides]